VDDFYAWKADFVSSGKKRWGTGTCWEYLESGRCMGMHVGAHPKMTLSHFGDDGNGSLVIMSRDVPEWRRVLVAHGFQLPAMVNNSNNPDSKDEVVSGDTVMEFGKHRGLKFSEVPTSYGNWALGLENPSRMMQQFVTYFKQKVRRSSGSSNIGGKSWANANRSVAWTSSMLRRMLPSAGMLTILDAEEQKKQENLQRSQELEEATAEALDEYYDQIL